jgi:hypothetical protein
MCSRASGNSLVSDTRLPGPEAAMSSDAASCCLFAGSDGGPDDRARGTLGPSTVRQVTRAVTERIVIAGSVHPEVAHHPTEHGAPHAPVSSFLPAQAPAASAAWSRSAIRLWPAKRPDLERRRRPRRARRASRPTSPALRHHGHRGLAAVRPARTCSAPRTCTSTTGCPDIRRSWPPLQVGVNASHA